MSDIGFIFSSFSIELTKYTTGMYHFKPPFTCLSQEAEYLRLTEHGKRIVKSISNLKKDILGIIVGNDCLNILFKNLKDIEIEEIKSFLKQEGGN